MTHPHRIAVFTGDLNHAVRKGIVELRKALPGASILVLLHRPRKGAAVLLRNQWRNLKRNGWRWIPYTLGDIAGRMRPSRAAAVAAGAPGVHYGLAALRADTGIELRIVDDLHGAEALEALRAFDADLGLSLAAPILKRPLFALPRLGTINLHKGKVPDYRGMPPAFWELWNDESAVGCTVHRVDDKLDTGDIVAQDVVARSRHSTLRGLQLQLDECGIALMRRAAVDLLEGRAAPQPQPAGGKTYRKPTLGQVAELAQRMDAVAPPMVAPARQIAKNVFAACAQRAWRHGIGRFAAPRITVLLYHRVSDEVRDNLTVGIEQFDRQMTLLARHCRVLSLDEVLAAQTVPRSDRPLVAVNFDDGYLDNFSHAAPILMRHGLPAAFFVSTGIVDSDGRFPHDVRRGNAPIPTMSWDQLRAMRDWGFTIGSHTVNHIDCAGEPEATVRRELDQSRDDLKRELGLEHVVLAYPYGGRQHMTPQRLELVRQAGYAGCLSAYGGTNVARVDRFNVLRRGIHWGFSDEAFLLECTGLR